MWANEEIKQLITWIHDYNQHIIEQSQMAGFYGIDIYSLWESMDEIIKLLESKGAAELEAAKKHFPALSHSTGNRKIMQSLLNFMETPAIRRLPTFAENKKQVGGNQ